MGKSVEIRVQVVETIKTYVISGVLLPIIQEMKTTQFDK